MITRPTVFVLGAGASKPYGFPTGLELHDLICALDRSPPNLPTHPDGEPLFTDFDFNRFTGAFRRSGLQSIDEFLSRHDVHVGPGKLAIAYILTRRENPDRIFDLGLQDNWYQYLWNLMTSGATTLNEFFANECRFITFNYDRSLEYYLHQTSQHTYGLSDRDALQLVLPTIPILHVYGKLGEFGIAESETARPYSSKFKSHVQINAAVSGIRIIPEDRASQEFTHARQWLFEAQRIIFLGFGFDPLNVQRLDIASVLEERTPNPPIVTFSAFGFTDAEVQSVKSRLYRRDPSIIRNGKTASQNLQFLRESGLLLTG